MGYNNVNDFIKDLIIARQDGITIDNFNSSCLEGLNQSELWKNLIDFLQDERNINKLRTSPILQSIFNESEGTSLFDYINEKADLDSAEIWSNLKNVMKDHIDLSTDSGVEDGTPYFWNESVSKLVAQFIKNLDSTTAQILIGKHNGNDVYMSVPSIKNADAGNSFDSIEFPEWVKPWTNIDEESYSTVRGNDKIETVLNNEDELQFTRKLSNNKWIRLLMPKYLRKVEVEDLNRNFWVLAQVISGISAYLFGNDSIEEILRGLINETIQLWENILYLWAAMALISQKDKITDIHTEVVPIANSELQGYIKFDNFGNTSINNPWSTIKSRVQYIIDSYPNSNVIVVPQIKKTNYKRNWYACEEYPGLIIYNRNLDKTYYLEFTTDDTLQTTVRPTIDLEEESKIIGSNFLDKLGAIREKNEFDYEYSGTFADTLIDVQHNDIYYALIRVIPEITANYDEETDIITIRTFALRAHDVAQELKTSNDHEVITFEKSDIVGWSTAQTDSNGWRLVSIEETITDIGAIEGTSTFDINQGYYQGELISYPNLLAEPKYDINFKPQFGQRLMVSSPRNIEKYLRGEINIDTVIGTISPSLAVELYNGDDGTNARLAEIEYLKAIKGENGVVKDIDTINNIALYDSGGASEPIREMTLYTLTHRTQYSTLSHSFDSRGFYTSSEKFLEDSSNVNNITQIRLEEQSPTFKVIDYSGKFYDGHAWSGSISSAACLVNKNVTPYAVTIYDGYYFQGSTAIPSITYLPQRLNNFHLFVEAGQQPQDDNWVIVYAECAHGALLPNVSGYDSYKDDNGYIVTKIFIHIFMPNGDYYRRIVDRSGDFKVNTSTNDLSKWAYVEYSSAGAQSNFATVWNAIHDTNVYTERTSNPVGRDYSKYWNNGIDTSVSQIAYKNDVSGVDDWSGGDTA